MVGSADDDSLMSADTGGRCSELPCRGGGLCAEECPGQRLAVVSGIVEIAVGQEVETPGQFHDSPPVAAGDDQTALAVHTQIVGTRVPPPVQLRCRASRRVRRSAAGKQVATQKPP